MAKKKSREITEILLDTIAAYNAADADGVPQHVLAEWNLFGSHPSRRGVDRDRLAEAFRAGLKTDLRWARLHVQTYDDDQNIAIATGRLEGWIRLPGGERLKGPWNFHKIWMKDEDGWRISSDQKKVGQHAPKGLKSPTS